MIVSSFCSTLQIFLGLKSIFKLCIDFFSIYSWKRIFLHVQQDIGNNTQVPGLPYFSIHCKFYPVMMEQVEGNKMFLFFSLSPNFLIKAKAKF